MNIATDQEREIKNCSLTDKYMDDVTDRLINEMDLIGYKRIDMFEEDVSVQNKGIG
jgi:hypothetical protein